MIGDTLGVVTVCPGGRLDPIVGSLFRSVVGSDEGILLEVIDTEGLVEGI